MNRILTVLIVLLLVTLHTRAAPVVRDPICHRNHHEKSPGWDWDNLNHQELQTTTTNFGLPDGEYHLRFQGYFLTQPEVADQSVLLDYNRGSASMWEVLNDFKRGISIRNVDSGLYLSYIEACPNSPLRMQPMPAYWALRPQELNGKIQIQATELYNGEVLVIDELPLLVSPPWIGLVLPQKTGMQGWDFKPIVGTSRRHWPGFSRLVNLRLNHWWNR